MEVLATNTSLNSSFRQQSVNAAEEKPVAFGIGAGQPKVELSPQARILQQTEQNLQAQQQTRPASQDKQQDDAEDGSSDFVRVSSSVGPSAQSNNLSAEKATELYKSIEKML
ncbi:hypothetical protein [Bowmanella denitrificans]|uniref:hypothetical protein n=1 Tax=Bowmanella denitrificans TaxID=366582 RepID=UPI000C9C5992|nr:hypothetical protein [Bowmanella denitrificans]